MHNEGLTSDPVTSSVGTPDTSMWVYTHHHKYVQLTHGSGRFWVPRESYVWLLLPIRARASSLGAAGTGHVFNNRYFKL